jgi:hypothetical protein
MKSEDRKQLDEILAYAAERGISVPADVLLQQTQNNINIIQAEIVKRSTP